MPKFCPLCGEAYVDGACPNQAQHFKPMCLNCVDCVYESADGNEAYKCNNEENMNKAAESVKNAVSGLGDIGYEVKIDLSPLPLKKPCNKCKRWKPDANKIIAATLQEYASLLN